MNFRENGDHSENQGDPVPAVMAIHRKIVSVVVGLICASGMITGCAGEQGSLSEQNLKDESEKMERDIRLLREEVRTLRKKFETDISLLRRELNALAARPTGLGYSDICERSPELQEIVLRELQLPSCQIVSERELLRITELSVTAEELWPGDLDGLRNIETLRLYLNSSPPGDLLSDVPNLAYFTLQQYDGICGNFAINGQPVEVRKSGDNCEGEWVRPDGQ